MRWNLINLKSKVVPYTLWPILLQEASSVPSCLWSLCHMSSEPDKTISGVPNGNFRENICSEDDL